MWTGRWPRRGAPRRRGSERRLKGFGGIETLCGKFDCVLDVEFGGIDVLRDGVLEREF